MISQPRGGRLFPYTTLFRSGVEDIFFLSMDGVSGLEQGAKAIFPKVIVQRCIVHLIRNSIKYVQTRSEEHTSELQSRFDLVCRLLLEKKTTKHYHIHNTIDY